MVVQAQALAQVRIGLQRTKEPGVHAIVDDADVIAPRQGSRFAGQVMGDGDDGVGPFQCLEGKGGPPPIERHQIDVVAPGRYDRLFAEVAGDQRRQVAGRGQELAMKEVKFVHLVQRDSQIEPGGQGLPRARMDAETVHGDCAVHLRALGAWGDRLAGDQDMDFAPRIGQIVGHAPAGYGHPAHVGRIGVGEQANVHCFTTRS